MHHRVGTSFPHIDPQCWLRIHDWWVTQVSCTVYIKCIVKVEQHMKKSFCCACTWPSWSYVWWEALHQSGGRLSDLRASMPAGSTVRVVRVALLSRLRILIQTTSTGLKHGESLFPWKEHGNSDHQRRWRSGIWTLRRPTGEAWLLSEASHWGTWLGVSLRHTIDWAILQGRQGPCPTALCASGCSERSESNSASFIRTFTSSANPSATEVGKDS